jgi:hypothetical protein
MQEIMKEARKRVGAGDSPAQWFMKQPLTDHDPTRASDTPQFAEPALL